MNDLWAQLLLFVYRAFGSLITPFLALSSLAPERKGFLPPAEIWMHAASVGEALAAAAIIRAIKRIRPRSRILLTLQTQTGLQKAQELVGSLPGIHLSLAPLDLPFYVKRALRNVSPRVLVLVETELWPNLLEKAGREEITLVLVNGRLSAQSFPRYQKIRPLIRHLLQKFYALGVIGPLEAKRFLRLGAEEEKVLLLGNAKYDLLRERAQKFSPQRVLRKLSSRTPWVVFGSVRRGEERPLAQVIARLQRERKDLSFLLAPRHLEALPSFEKALGEEKLTFKRWSGIEHPETGLILLDEIGPLFETYAQAQVAFVGGSLVPKGGQNPLEPAAFKVPVLFGPHMENFPYEAEQLVSRGGGQRVNSPEDLLERLQNWLEQEEERKKAGLSAYQVLEEFAQAAERYAELVIKALNRLPL